MKRGTVGLLVGLLVGTLVVGVIKNGVNANSLRQDASKSYGYNVKQAPGYFFGGLGSGPKLFWVDAQRILFLGLSEDDHRERLFAKQDPIFSVRLWDIRTGQIDDIGRARGSLCFFRGELSYLVSFDSNHVVRRKGSLTETVEIVRPRKEEMTEAMNARGEQAHPFNCRQYRWADLGEEGVCRTPFIDGDGFLDASGSGCSKDARSRREEINTTKSRDSKQTQSRTLYHEIANRPVLYFSSLGAKPVVLPIKSYEIYPIGKSMDYASWAPAYTVVARPPQEGPWGGRWPKGEPFVVYAIHPGGAVDVYKIPQTKDFRRAPLKAMLTRSGLLLVNNDLNSMDDPGPAGLYLMRDDQITRVYNGFISELAISPDGCRAVFGVRVGEQKHGTRFVVYLRTLDVCEGR